MNKSDMDFFARVFGALADPTRQHILKLLREKDEMTVTDIAGNFELTQPTISQHLRILKEVGVVKARKSGQYVYYRICDVKIYDAMQQFMTVIKTEVRENKL